MKPTEMEIYLFDLRGYLILENALTAEEVDELNAGIDALLPAESGEWIGYVHSTNFGANDGLNFQQIYEAGEPFEKLIDHPSWFEKIKYFVGGEGSFDWLHGPLFIDENFANLRGPGEAIPLHSGAHECVKRTQYMVKNGKFMCGQVNILIALTDMMPGDGATMVIPGSHKSNFAHPHFAQHDWNSAPSVDGVVGAVEANMKVGDALLFVDAISHGAAKRTNPGQRRNIVYRYGPSWGNFRHGYEPSPELLERLTPQRRQIVRPMQLKLRTPQRQAR
jgi:ectoine hydroxylase-related dioxygenase (phytanoyl-CoA dioxygenase family)